MEAQDGHLDFHTAPELCSCSVVVGGVLLYVHRNRGFIRHGEPRMATSTFTQLQSFERDTAMTLAIPMSLTHPTLQLWKWKGSNPEKGMWGGGREGGSE